MCMHNCELCGKCPGKDSKVEKIPSGYCVACSIQYSNYESACSQCGRPLPWPPGTRKPVPQKELH